MSRLSPTRRAFLRAMGAGMAALPFSRLLENSVAQAAGETLPLKFITIYHPHGISAEFWAMKGADTETAFDIGYANCSLKPFDDAATYGKSFKNQILTIEGIDHLSNANGHDSAGTILTGSYIDGSARKPMNASLDQFLAVTQGLGKDTPITSVNLGVGNDATDPGLTLSYGDGGAPLPKIIDPVAAFNLLFGNYAMGTDPAAAAAAARKQKLGQAVVDYVRWDINRLRTGLAPAEQQKLDQHLSALADLEKSISATALMSCVVPPMPDASQFPQLRQYNGGEPYFDAITNAHIDMISSAFACDITRFATLFMNDLSYAGNPLMLPADNHGSVAHPYNASAVGANSINQAGDPATWLPLAELNGYFYSKIARLMQKLDQFGILDSTLIYVASDMGNPALHSTRNVPTVLAGGANGKFRMGRRLKMPAACPASNPWCNGDNPRVDYTPTTNNKILVSIAQAFGVDVNAYGTMTVMSDTMGALSQLT
ncbi:MAG TPA: DUF1552 domain-containing protein [Polyangiaceae bacterium]|jgi:hypothetical protein